MSKFDIINTNAGHGHAWPRPDGKRARCSGIRVCNVCTKHATLVAQAINVAKAAERVIETNDAYLATCAATGAYDEARSAHAKRFEGLRDLTKVYRDI